MRSSQVAALAAVLLTPIVSRSQEMFRGGPEHTGRYAASGGEYGGIAWRVQTGAPIRSSATVTAALVLVGNGDGNLYAFDRTTGAERWRFPATGGVQSAPAVAGGTVFVATATNNFYAIDLATGRQRWHFVFGADAPLAWDRASGDYIVSSPVISGNTVVVGSGDGFVYAFESVMGKVRWRFKTGGRVRSSPAISHGVVYAASFDGSVYAIDLPTGAQRWRYDTEGRALNSAQYGYDRRSIQSSPAIASGVVYVGSRDGHLYAIDAEHGTLRWRVAHDETSWSIASPAIGDGVVIDASSDAAFVHALRVSDGKELWRLTTPAPVWSSPAIGGSTIFVGDGDGNVHAIDATAGTERWRFRTGGAVYSSPVIVDGVVFVGSVDGAIYALRTSAPPALRRAVFWDSASAAHSRHGELVVIRDYLRNRGYEVIAARDLSRWLHDRTTDRAPSVLVFADDQLPSDVVGARPSSGPFRNYLASGGKIVWVGDPPLMWPPDSAGEHSYATLDWHAPTALLDVDHSAAQFDRYGARPTADGQQWGLGGWWMSVWSIKPSRDVTVLATDERGFAASWTKSFGGPRGTGYVFLNRTVWRADDLAQLETVAEYRPAHQAMKE